MASTQTTVPPENSFSGTRPLTDRLEKVVESWSRTQYELVTLAAEFADSPEWLLTGSPTAAHWLAIIADVEPCTTREWIRIGRKLAELPAIADAFKTRAISYSKVRTLTRLATPNNEHELLGIATTTTAADLGRALAAWLHRTSNDEDVAAYHPDSIVAGLIPTAFISALLHDAKGHPIDATNRRRHPNRRQKRLVKERDQTCIDCRRHDLLEYDHIPAYEQTGHTITTELELRCAPCHHNRHTQND